MWPICNQADNMHAQLLEFSSDNSSKMMYKNTGIILCSLHVINMIGCFFAPWNIYDYEKTTKLGASPSD